MFHKRLLKEFSDNRKYVAGMVIMQWAALLANVALMYVLAAYVGENIRNCKRGETHDLPVRRSAAYRICGGAFCADRGDECGKPDVLSCVHAGEAQTARPGSMRR